MDAADVRGGGQHADADSGVHDSGRECTGYIVSRLYVCGFAELVCRLVWLDVCNYPICALTRDCREGRQAGVQAA